MEKLASDQRGAVMVIAVFMMVIAAGILYYMVGLGDAILMKERMQDAADASAYSAAVVNARGMNAIALINIIMAAVLAAFVLLKLMASTMKVAAGAMLAAALFFAPLYGASKVTYKLADKIENAADHKVEPVVKKTLIAAHKLAKGVRTVTPKIAALKITDVVQEGYSPPATLAFSPSIGDKLPAVDGAFSDLCTKAGDYAARLVSFPIDWTMEKVGVGKDLVGDIVADGVRALTTTFSGYYCGSSDKEPKPYTVEYDVVHPQLDTEAARSCRQNYERCEEAQSQQQAIDDAYDKATGTCSSSGETQALCIKRMADARRICSRLEGPEPDEDDLESWRWYERTIIKRYELREINGKKKVLLVDTDDRSPVKQISSEMPPPCHPIFQSGAYLQKMFSDWSNDPKNPLCVEKHTMPNVNTPGWQTDAYGVRFIEFRLRQIKDIDGCSAEHSEEIDPAATQMDKDLMKNVPQEMCGCAELGEHIFQVRVAVLGSPLDHIDDKSVNVANFGKDPRARANSGSSDSGIDSTLSGSFDIDGLVEKGLEYSSRVAVAQAEYYFSADSEALNRSEWLWHMRWMARMRRFHLKSTGWECKEKKDNCPALLLSADQLSAVGVIDNVIMH